MKIIDRVYRGLANRMIQKGLIGPIAMVNADRVWSVLGAADAAEYFSSWVWYCINKNSGLVGRTPLRVYAPVSKTSKSFSIKTIGAQDEIAEELDDHPIKELLDQPNNDQGSHEFWALTNSWLEIDGNAYLRIVFDKFGFPAALYVLPADHVEPEPGEDRLVKRYRFRRKSAIEYVDPEEVLHIKVTNPSTPHKGKGPLHAAMAAIQRYMTIQDFEYALFKNQARPDTHIKLPAGTPKPERDAIRNEVMAKFTGKNIGKPLVTTGDVDLTTLQWNPRDAQVLTLAKAAREEIILIFGLAPTMLEISASRAEDESKRRAYGRDTIQPRLSRIDSALTRKLAPYWDDRLTIEFDSPVPEDTDLEIERLSKLVERKIITVDEARHELGFESMADDDKPQATQPVIPQPAPEQEAEDED